MSVENPNPAHRIALFQKKEIRRTLHNGEWWFVITDVIVRQEAPSPSNAGIRRASSA